MTAVRLVGDAKQYLHSLAALALATPPHRIAGPARTLIPSRSLLVRRVEMLRTLGISRPRRPAARYATFAAVALFAVAAAGFRGPTIQVASAAFADESSAKNAAAPVERLSLEVVPPDALFVVSARPAQIVAQDELRELPKMFTDLTHLLAEAKLTPSDVVEVMAMQYGKADLTPAAAPQRFSNARIVVRFATPAKRQQFREWMLARVKTERINP